MLLINRQIADGGYVSPAADKQFASAIFFPACHLAHALLTQYF
ncbi:hypothetical protein J3D56_001241 [Erwinia persicina]|jgi:hypothetical protein|uniref:Uncharacterized protein n=1 Tax=Erwinia aeris TaxID=3239803 RepID=A0ABV4E581_9GAMM|nr:MULTISPECIES: hypothetical protein [Erwinia]MCP1437805.1 hypothetical protein [Erwinia persicina]MDN4628093.1 hypothetical protein [Erwinia sp. PsM31]